MGGHAAMLQLLRVQWLPQDAQRLQHRHVLRVWRRGQNQGELRQRAKRRGDGEMRGGETIKCTTWYCSDCGKSRMVVPRGALDFDSDLAVGVGCRDCSGCIEGVDRKRPLGPRSKHYSLAKYTLNRMRNNDKEGVCRPLEPS